MENESAKRRGWIKNIAIIFLLILLLLTFFSNTILTYSLPEVSAQYPQYSSLNSSVKLNGTIRANASYSVVYEPDIPVTAQQTRRVKSVYVREGDYVSEGQPVLVVNGGMSEELKAAQAEYEAAKKEYDLALLGVNRDSIDSKTEMESKQKAYDEAKKNLDTLQKRYDDLTKNMTADEIQTKIKSLKTALTEAETKLDQINIKINAAKEIISTADPDVNLIDAEKGFATIEATYNTLKTEESSLSTRLKELGKTLDNMKTANNLTNDIESLEEANAMLYGDLANNVNAIMENNTKIAEAEKKLKILGLEKVSNIELFEEQHRYDEMYDHWSDVSAELDDYVPVYEQAKANMEAVRKQNTASSELKEYTDLLDVTEKQIESLQKELENYADPDDLQKQIAAAEEELKYKKNDLEKEKISANIQNTQTNSELTAKKKACEEAAERIKQYENAPELLEVNSPVSGRVVSVNASVGDSISSGMTVVNLEIADKGYISEITVTSEEARKIQVGAPVTISNSWWYSNQIEASVKQIRSDPASQGKNKIVLIEVNGDVYDGQSFTFSIGDRSSYYECVLPNSAIRDDNEGSFVLTVESKKTPLGVRYTARRVEIEIIASDDTNSAVSGLFGSEFVITNATTPISDKQQVRLAEN